MYLNGHMVNIIQSSLILSMITSAMYSLLLTESFQLKTMCFEKFGRQNMICIVNYINTILMNY